MDKAYRHEYGMDMTKDKTFEYEKRRNRPMRYNRNVTEQTLKAIKKIDKIRVAREVSHIEKRWKGNAGKERREGKQELDQSIHMITAPSVLREEASKIKVPVSQSQTEDAKEEWSI